MKLIAFLLITIFHFAAHSVASEERKLYLEIEAERVFQGEIYLFQFVAYPADTAFSEKLEKASLGTFVNGIKITRVIDSGFSENNADAYVIKFEGLVLNDKIDSLIELDGEKLSFEYKGEAIIPFTELSENLLIRELSYFTSKRHYILVIIGFLALVLLVVFGKKYLKWQRKKIMMKKNRNEWKARLIGAKTREEYEFLYSRRSELATALNLANTDQATFIATMEELQYKKFLNPEEMRRIEQEFEKIRMQIQ